jgi:hypothetical protein
MLLRQSMHRPGYVQGGQEAKRGYLLLGVHYRRIHSSTQSYMFKTYFPDILHFTIDNHVQKG